MQAVWDFLLVNKTVILAVLLGISEILGSFEYFKASSIFESIVNFIKKLKEEK